MYSLFVIARQPAATLEPCHIYHNDRGVNEQDFMKSIAINSGANLCCMVLMAIMTSCKGFSYMAVTGV